VTTKQHGAILAQQWRSDGAVVARWWRSDGAVVAAAFTPKQSVFL